ncbi:MAG: T9SS type A sorting domain-containing protein [Bacteroidota bacterium]
MTVFSRWLPLVALLTIACCNLEVHAQDWEEVYFEDFTTSNSNLTNVPNFTHAGAAWSPGGASGLHSDRCARIVMNHQAHYLAFELNFSTDYEYFVSFNGKKTHGFAKQVEIVHSSTPPVFNQPPTGTLIGSAIDITQTGQFLPGQVYDSEVFSGLSGSHYIIFRKPASAGNGPPFNKILFDDFKLYRRSIGGTSNPVVNILTTNQTVDEGATTSNQLTIDVVPTEAVSVSLDLTFASNTHFSGFTPQPITFPALQSGNQPFDLTPAEVPGLAAGIYTYVFAITPIGTNVDIGSFDEVTINVNVEEPTCDFALSLDISTIVCDDNFTPNDSTDDTYTFDFQLIRSDGQPGTWSGFFGSQTIAGTYGTTSPLGPFNISDGNMAITITDAVNPVCTVSATGIPPLPCSNGDGDDVINFVQTQQTIIEGETAGLCLRLWPNNTFTEDVYVDIELLDDESPYFSNFETETVTIPTGSNAVVCLPVPSRVEAGERAEVLTYRFAITNPRLADGTPVTLGQNAIHTVKVVDASSARLLYPGDIAFIGFDNFVGNETDRIVLANMVPLSPGTRFSIANANYCSLSETWFEAGGGNPLQISQEITYSGDDDLPVGSIICLDLPGGGTGSDLLATNFQINGVSTSDFSVQNSGINSEPNINLSATQANNLYLTSGDWVFDATATTLLGRSIAVLQVGDTDSWLANNCAGGTHLPEDLDCVAGPDFPAGGSSYGYFDCSQYGTNLSRLDYLMYAANSANWTTGAGTTILDLPGTACDPACNITTDSLYWMIPPTDLVISCLNDGSGVLDTWLQNYGSGVPVTTCPDGEITVFNDFDGWPPVNTICDGDTLEVIFTAVDNCGNRADCVGLVIIQTDEREMEISVQPSNLSVVCTDVASVNMAYMDWIADWGGMEVDFTCGLEPIFGVVDGAVPPLSCNSQTEVVFFAVGLCNDTVFADPVTFSIVDNTPPVITSPPVPLTVDCNHPEYTRQIDEWIRQGGNASAEDECLPTIRWITSGSTGTYTCGTTTINFQASDACGNLSPVVSTTLTITDNTPPVLLTPPADITIAVDDPGLNDFLNLWLTGQFADASDACGDVSWTNDYDTSQPLPLCIPTPVTFTVSDDCGNSIQTVAFFTITEEVAPVIANAPQGLEIDCSAADFDTQVNDWLNNFGYMTATDNSGLSPSLSYDISSTNLQQVCGSYPVVFYAVDACGNLTSTTATIIVEDDNELTAEYINGGQDITLVLGDLNFDSELEEWLSTGGGRPDLVNGCYSEFTWTHDFYDQVDLADFGEDCRTITVNFVLETGCVAHTLPPLDITINLDGLRQKDPGYDLTLACQCDAGSNTVLDDWLANDGGIVFENCVDATPIVITHSAPNTDDLTNCVDQTITFTITQGSTSFTIERQLIMSAPVCSPLITNSGYDLELSCGAPSTDDLNNWLAAVAGITVADACGTMSWTYSTVDGDDINDCFDQTVTFTGTDACGNVVTVQRQILMICDLSVSIVDNGTQLCAQLDGTCAGNTIFTWSNGQIGQCITPNGGQVTTYTVTASCSMTDGNGFPVCTDLTSEPYTYYPDCPNDYGLSINYISSINLLHGQLTGCNGTPSYQWSLDGQVIPGATDQDYSPTVTGTYALEVTNCLGCAPIVASYYWCENIDVTIDPDCTTTNYDILFLFDNSGSISQQEFDDLKASILNTVADVESRVQSATQVRYGLVAYNTNDPSFRQWINTWQHAPLTDFARPSGNCARLEFAVSQLHTDFGGAFAPRTNAQLHIVLYTDSPKDTSLGGCSSLAPAPYVDHLKNDFGAIFSVVRYNIGNTALDDEANAAAAAIASSPDRFFVADEFDEPIPLAEDIVICRELTAIVTGSCVNPTYQWEASYGGSIIGSSTVQTIDINGQGFYSVTVTCDDGCTGEAYFPENIYNLQSSYEEALQARAQYMLDPYIGGTEEPDDVTTETSPLQGLQMKLFPNPTKDEFYLDVYTARATSCSIMIRDARGRLLIQEQHELDARANLIRLDAAAFPSGVYWVILNTGDEIHQRKLIVE